MVKVALDNSQPNAPASAELKRPPAVRKSRWLTKLFLLGVIFVGLGPSLITWSGQGPALLSKLHPRLGQTVSYRSFTLHWWAPVEVRELKVRDLSLVDEQNPVSNAPLLCEMERAATVEPLWRIAMNAGRGTGVLLKSPRLTLVADESGTNIERTVTALFGESKQTSAARFPFRVIIEDGAIELSSSSSSLMSDSLKSDSVMTSTQEPADEVADEPVVAATSVSSVPVAASVSAIHGTFSTMDTERWLPEMKLAASIRNTSADVVAKAAREKKSVSRPTRLAAGLDDVVSDFPEVPLEDLAGTDEKGDATGARIQIHLKPRADEQGRQTIQFGARDVDLRLLQPFLSLVGLDASCEGIISGGLDARLAGADLKEGLVGRLKLEGDNVRVRQQSWAVNEWLPLGKLNASGAVAIAEDGILIQDMEIKSDVVQVTGSGELRHRANETTGSNEKGSQQIEIKGAMDVAQLGSSLRRTLMIHEDVAIQRGRVTFALRGSAGAKQEVASLNKHDDAELPAASSAGTSTVPLVPVSFSSADSQNGTWQMVVRTEDLAATRAGQALTVDSTLRVDAVGTFQQGMPALSRARLTAGFGTIDCDPDGAAWKVSGLVQPAALWQQLRQFADVPEPGLRGDVSFQSRVLMQGDTIQLTGLQVNSSDVKASSVALEIRPSNPVTSMLDGTVHLEGSGAALRTLLAPWHDASWLSERANVVGDLTATPTREIQLTVRVTPDQVANLQRSNVLSVSRTNGRAHGSQRTASSSAFAIDEAELELSMRAKSNGQQFDIQNGLVKLPGLVALVTGSVSVPEGEAVVDITADTTYDLDVLSRRLFSADSGLSFSGEGRDVFRLNGSPSALSGVRTSAQREAAPALTGSGKIQWSAANVWGLQVGPATVQASLENSLLRSEPIQCSVNGGNLNVMPQYDLGRSRLQLGSGSRVQNLKVTPELCRTWLGYVAPMLADTAQVNGEVSARVERFFWDFNVPENSDVAAQLTIHQAEAAAGSSLASLLDVVNLLRKSGDGSPSLSERTLVLPAQTIPIQVRQGYVAHEGLVMELSGYRMTTSGAVGLNKQLQMTIDVPLEKSSATSTGRSIRVPLRGTISQPQPDTGALLQNLGTQKIQEKLGDQVDKTLNKQLNKLFDKF